MRPYPRRSRRLPGSQRTLASSCSLAFFYSRRWRLTKRAGSSKTAVRLSPRDPIATLELARVLIALNRLDEAEALLQPAWLVGPEPRRLRALVRMRRGEYAGAGRSSRGDRRHRPARFRKLGRSGLSLRCRRCRQVDRGARPVDCAPRPAPLPGEMGGGARRRGKRRASASDGPRSGGAASSDPVIRLTVARLEDLLGRPERAVSALDASLAIDPGFAPATAGPRKAARTAEPAR